MSLKLRAACPKDAPVLTDILHRSKGSWGYPESLMAEFREHWRITEATLKTLSVTIAEINHSPVAFCGVIPSGEDTLLIDFLFVAPEAQGCGVGHVLLTRAEDHARALGRNRLYLESDAHAGSFYESHGYTTIATRASEMSPGKDIPMMEKRLPPAVQPLKALNVSLSPAPWRFETENAEAVETHFAALKHKNPHLWNGRTLKLTGYTLTDGVFSGTCTETSYAAFLTWRDWGAPDCEAYNMFGSAVIVSSDGALLYGVMASHTATSGWVYPPGGNLDPGDIRSGGIVDVEGSIYRELEEETGLRQSQVRPGPLLVTLDGPRISIARVIHVDKPAELLRQEILDHSLKSAEQELADIRIYRQRPDFSDPAIVPYARALGLHVLATMSRHQPA
ncbi:GNAT family N-acetyltransferase [Roseibium sp. RKSG952]|nr:GNAT family N-acetyltransferase [Roseibium sp. RKSG952]MTH94967.1 GNAT family N-acetyltransferase [Roseibium sp. RKSG952]